MGEHLFQKDNFIRNIDPILNTENHYKCDDRESCNCLMVSLKELYLAGNYLNKNSYEIKYLKEHIKKVII